MTPRELAAVVERATGIKAPPDVDGAPNEAWDAWHVATTFVLTLQANSSPAEGRAKAATDILRQHDERDLPRYLRFVEEGLRRPLTDAELAAREVRVEGFELEAAVIAAKEVRAESEGEITPPSKPGRRPTLNNGRRVDGKHDGRVGFRKRVLTPGKLRQEPMTVEDLFR
jgi:hypothetical protein